MQTLLQHQIDQKTKPLGALGRLEDLALQIGLIQQTTQPQLRQPHLVVFAADHGAALHGVSAYPQEVTWQMVMNFLAGGAAINVFCRQHQINLKVADAGVNFDFDSHPQLINAKIAKGTQPFHLQTAMTENQAQQAMDKGAAIVRQIAQTGCNIIGFGEMGIGNTSAASLLMAFFTDLPLNVCIGTGTGVDEKGLQRKHQVLNQAYELHKHLKVSTKGEQTNGQAKEQNPLAILAAVGGFEIAMLTGAMLQAAKLHMVVLVDGFIASASFLVATIFQPTIRQYAIACHVSAEQGHQKLLEYLGLKPLLQLDMRLGEGTGVAVAYPLLESAVRFLNEMASFESAGVSVSK